MLVVLGRGWNQYDFDACLKLSANPSRIPANRVEFYERNRNLFYVCCSRPRERLALLFTQQLSPEALQLLNTWFGRENVYDVGMGTFPQT